MTTDVIVQRPNNKVRNKNNNQQKKNVQKNQVKSAEKNTATALNALNVRKDQLIIEEHNQNIKTAQDFYRKVDDRFEPVAIAQQDNERNEAAKTVLTNLAKISEAQRDNPFLNVMVQTLMTLLENYPNVIQSIFDMLKNQQEFKDMSNQVNKEISEITYTMRLKAYKEKISAAKKEMVMSIITNSISSFSTVLDLHAALRSTPKAFDKFDTIQQKHQAAANLIETSDQALNDLHVDWTPQQQNAYENIYITDSDESKDLTNLANLKGPIRNNFREVADQNAEYLNNAQEAITDSKQNEHGRKVFDKATGKLTHNLNLVQKGERSLQDPTGKSKAGFSSDYIKDLNTQYEQLQRSIADAKASYDDFIVDASITSQADKDEAMEEFQKMSNPRNGQAQLFRHDDRTNTTWVVHKSDDDKFYLYKIKDDTVKQLGEVKGTNIPQLYALRKNPLYLAQNHQAIHHLHDARITNDKMLQLRGEVTNEFKKGITLVALAKEQHYNLSTYVDKVLPYTKAKTSAISNSIKHQRQSREAYLKMVTAISKAFSNASSYYESIVKQSTKYQEILADIQLSFASHIDGIGRPQQEQWTQTSGRQFDTATSIISAVQENMKNIYSTMKEVIAVH